MKQVSVGRRHVVAVTTTGEGTVTSWYVYIYMDQLYSYFLLSLCVLVYAMGLNCFGQCGVSTHTEQLLSLQQVKELRHVSKVRTYYVWIITSVCVCIYYIT